MAGDARNYTGKRQPNERNNDGKAHRGSMAIAEARRKGGEKTAQTYGREFDQIEERKKPESNR